MRQSSDKSIFVDPSKCTGCHICELVCSEHHEENYGLRKSRIRVTSIGNTIRLAMSCRLCKKAPCVASCPRDALRQHEDTGTIVVDENKCTGCKWCIGACDFGVIFFHPIQKTPIICDLCGKDEPQCIRACQKEAIQLITEDAFLSQIRKNAAEKLTKSIGEAK